MLNFFKKKTEDDSTSFKMFLFKEAGIQPFADIDFSKQNVFQIVDFTLRELDKGTKIFDEFVNTSSYFEVWIVPTNSNHILSKISLVEKLKAKNNPQLQAYLDSLNNVIEKFDADFKVLNSYLLVNKNDSEMVENKFKKLSLHLRSMSADEAKEIIVLNGLDKCKQNRMATIK